MKKQARLVVIGSGVAGLATCYHLVDMGWTDIVVLDQGPLFRTGGSTSHAPGGMFQVNASKWMTECARYTVETFANLEVDGVKGGTKAGGIELAVRQERWQELQRRSGLAKSWGLDPQLLTPSECRDLIPILNKDAVLGGLYVPDDMIGNAMVSAHAMGYYIQDKGVEFHGNIEVTDIVVTNGRVSEVQTKQGSIKTDQVLVCAGIWGPKMADMVGEGFPMQPMQHQYVKTESLDELKQISNNGADEINMPLIRLQDSASYYRQHHDCLGMGNYYHAPLAVNAHDILPNEQSKIMASIMDFTPEHFARMRENSERVFPCVKGKEFTYEINGMFSFTADGMPLMGESMKTKGFWMCEGVWVTHAAGVGKAMAEWLHYGRPQIDVHEGDFNRFYPYQKTKKFALARGKQQYREVYDIVHPNQQMSFPRPLRRSPFYERQVTLGAEFWEVVGWERPQWYQVNYPLAEKYDDNYHYTRRGWEAQNWSTTQIGEHLHTREHAGLFDLSAFSKFEVSGAGALAFLQRLCVNNVDVAIDKVVYTSMVNQHGGVESDLTVTRLAENVFWVLTGGGNGPHDMAWLRTNLDDDEVVHIQDLSSAYCVLGLWGPKARDILQPLVAEDISNEAFPFYSHKSLTVGYIPVKALRLSFVGELGWEIYCPTEFGLALWDSIWQAGQAHGLIAAGAGAFDSLRIEKGYLNWGSDIKPEHDPFMAGLGRMVKLNKSVPIVGQEALQQLKDKPCDKVLCTLSLSEHHAILGNEPIIHEGSVVSYVTSTNTGYSINQQVALCYLPKTLSEVGTELTVEYLCRQYPAVVVQSPLFDPTNSRLKS